jgi:hypothetical protein
MTAKSQKEILRVLNAYWTTMLDPRYEFLSISQLEKFLKLIRVL